MKKKILFVIPIIACGLILTNISSNNSAPILADSETHIVSLGEKITVKNRRLINLNTSDYKEVSGLIITPSGATYRGREFTTKEHGKYEVRYEAYFDDLTKVSESIIYLCQRQSLDYFETDDATISYGEYRYNTRFDEHKGVVFDVKNGSKIRFNEPLDMSDFMIPQEMEQGETDFRNPSYVQTANSLIDLIIDPSKKGTADFTGLSITLTDVDDPFNIVELRCEAAGGSDERAGALSYTRVGHSDGFLAGWEFGWGGHEGHFHYTSSGTGVALSFKGQPYENRIHSGNFLLDYSNYRFYTYPGSLSHSSIFFMNDLDDIEVYKSNPWEGFTSGKCYVTLTPYNFNNSKGRLIIKSVGKYSFLEETLPDDIAPTISVDTKGNSLDNLPNALVNSYYPVFPAVVTDNFDNNLKVTTRVIYKGANNSQDIDVPVIDDRFKTEKEGVYKIIYSASDRSGNLAEEKIITITAVRNISEIAVSLDKYSEDVDVLDSVILPSTNEVTTSGGSGKKEIIRRIIDPQNKEVEIIGNILKVNEVGSYRVVYQATDYLGNTGSATLVINVKELTAPKFIDHINLPPVMISGFSYSLNKAQAIETINGEVIPVEANIKVNGAPYSEEVVAAGTNMHIEYIATGLTGTVTKAFDIPIVDVSSEAHVIDQSAYFYGNINTSFERDYITLSANADASTVFANVLDVSNFYLAFEKINNGTNFDILEFTLTDSEDDRIHVTSSLNMLTNKLTIPGGVEVPYALSGNELFFSYKNDKQTIYDTLDNEVAIVKVDDLGSPFNGFEKGAYLSLTMKDVRSASSIKITKIDNQTLGYKNNGGDVIDPIISFDEQLVFEQFIGNEFKYSKFEAYDVLSQVETATIRILKPDGTFINGDNRFSDTFILEEYGQYSVFYQAVDKEGNTTRMTRISFVYDDQAPTLQVNNLSKTTYQVGEAVSIPKYTASDNSDYYVDVILILPTNEMRILTHEDKDGVIYALTDATIYNQSFIRNQTSFYTELKGIHRLRYVAYDDEFNTTMVELVFEVK